MGYWLNGLNEWKTYFDQKKASSNNLMGWLRRLGRIEISNIFGNRFVWNDKMF